MIVAGIQFDICWENPQENFERVAPLVASAAEMGAEIIALPEMFATGFSMRAHEMAAHAESIRSFIEDLAERYGLWVIGGYTELGERMPANACTSSRPTAARSYITARSIPFRSPERTTTSRRAPKFTPLRFPESG
jgi:predicted amidohydrolase